MVFKLPKINRTPNSPEAIRIFMKEVAQTTSYHITPQGLVNVGGNVLLNSKNLTHLPFKFGIVNGDFSLSDNQLINLENSPNEVKGSFYCSNNPLASTAGCPKIILKNFVCRDTPIEILESKDLPEKVGGLFIFSDASEKTIKHLEIFYQNQEYTQRNPKTKQTEDIVAYEMHITLELLKKAILSAEQKTRIDIMLGDKPHIKRLKI